MPATPFSTHRHHDPDHLHSQLHASSFQHQAISSPACSLDNHVHRRPACVTVFDNHARRQWPLLKPPPSPHLHSRLDNELLDSGNGHTSSFELQVQHSHLEFTCRPRLSTTPTTRFGHPLERAQIFVMVASRRWQGRLLSAGAFYLRYRFASSALKTLQT